MGLHASNRREFLKTAGAAVSIVTRESTTFWKGTTDDDGEQ